jgi:hypothetical protein
MGQCPSSFRGTGNFSCVSTCPAAEGFEYRTDGGQPKCVYKADTQFFVNLTPVEAVSNGGKTIPKLDVEAIKDIDITLYSKYKTEQDRVIQELAILYEKISKDQKLRDAFQRLQDAENVRDQAPDAYQQARSNYYTLKEGDKWLEREKERMLKAEVEPVVKKLVDTKTNALRQYESQRKTVDVVNGLKDNVLSLKDEMKYAADTFQEQLDKVKEAINRERRGRVTETKVSIWDWADFLLNGVIVISLLYVIYILYKKFAYRPAPVPSAVILRG